MRAGTREAWPTFHQSDLGTPLNQWGSASWGKLVLAAVNLLSLPLVVFQLRAFLSLVPPPRAFIVKGGDRKYCA